MNLIPVWVLDGSQATKALDRNSRAFLIVIALILALISHEGVFFIIAAGFVWRLFTKDLPAVPSSRALAYFAALLVFFALVIKAVPGHGFAR
jgi:membrane-associated protease RseP (regulator of RpoE activity)